MGPFGSGLSLPHLPAPDALPLIGFYILLAYLAWRVLTYFWRSRRPPWIEADMRFRVGRPGSGKTLLSVKEAILAMREGRAVYANMTIIDPVSGRRSGVVEGWAHLLYMTEEVPKGGLGLRNLFILVDEGNVWACSRLSKDIPIWLLFWWSHRRKFGAELHVTSQHENRVDVVLRETVDLIDVCERYRWLPRYLPIFKRTECFPEDLEALRAGKVGGSKPRLIPWWVYGGYGTDDAVPPLDLDAEKKPAMEGERIVHPNYLPGIPWDGKKLSKKLRLAFTGPDAWKRWKAFVDDHPELIPRNLCSFCYESWLLSPEGQRAVYALGDR